MSAEPARHLRLVDSDGAERIDLPHYEDLESMVEILDGKLKGALLENHRLKKELRDFQAVEPEHNKVLEVLEHWAALMVEVGVFRRRPAIKVGSARWKAVRARLREKHENRDPYTVNELMLVPEGALLSDFHRSKREYMDAESLYSDSGKVDKHIERAVQGDRSPLLMFLRLPNQLREIIRSDPNRLEDMFYACTCGHVVCEHSRWDPARDGAQPCLVAGCACGDLDSVMDWSRRHVELGRMAA